MLQATSSLKSKFDGFDRFALHLHTPAHQGMGPQVSLLSKDLLYLDSPYITRCDLKPLEAKVSEYYGTEHTFVLTAGASQGLLTTLITLGRTHQRVWVQRNCHKSVIGGLILAGLEPVFLAPKERILSVQDLNAAFAEFSEKAPTCIILTNPTYEGWGCDLETCIAACRAQGLTVVVDEAHGSLWPATSLLPQSAIALGADLVVHSLHKYCGAIVQSALVHLPKGSRIAVEDFQSALELVETTSKSNLILLSIEETLDQMFSALLGDRLILQLAKLEQIRNRITSSDGVLKLMEPDCSVRDPLKLFVASDKANPAQLVRYFADLGVDYELYDTEGVLFIFSIYHSDADLDLFEAAMDSVIQRIGQEKSESLSGKIPHYNQPHMKLSPRSAHHHPSGFETIPLSQAMGRIAGEMVASCPPGWPLVIPGEVLGDWHRETLGNNFKVKVLREALS
ncbi:MAG: aminotransferase class I/II-fold pyridoxal phosphate-dependent enzyme [Acaryochloridaceae cyanobacterium RU_4_10]|nr:aminotransferase class I/II-fold pyridoxal phosphate-dependent enzyme [Acaryochloridaceae cyanobacterium RU_4_10]